jgi:hypothetical protein
MIALASHNGRPLDVSALRSARSPSRSQKPSASWCFLACKASVGLPLISIVNIESESRSFIYLRLRRPTSLSSRYQIIIAAQNALDVECGGSRGTGLRNACDNTHTGTNYFQRAHLIKERQRSVGTALDTRRRDQSGRSHRISVSRRCASDRPVRTVAHDRHHLFWRNASSFLGRDRPASDSQLSTIFEAALFAASFSVARQNPCSWFIGVVAWTLAEYIVHRFVLHYLAPFFFGRYGFVSRWSI